MKIQLTVIFIIITLLLPCFSAKGQHFVVYYQYDNSGNRVCQSAVQVSIFDPKTVAGGPVAQSILSQPDTLSQASASRLYSQAIPAVKDDEKDRRAKAKSEDAGKKKE